MSYKNKKLSGELGFSLAVLGMLALLIHPYWMPMGLIVVCIAVLSALIFGLGVFVWQENPRDEREYALVSQAGRNSYLLGAAVLTVGVAVQTLQHHVDLWLVFSLAGMVLAKVITRVSKD
jgi:membrane glycosyltransferase